MTSHHVSLVVDENGRIWTVNWGDVPFVSAWELDSVYEKNPMMKVIKLGRVHRKDVISWIRTDKPLPLAANKVLGLS